MTGWIIVTVILFLLAALALIPVGFIFSYDINGFRLLIQISKFSFSLPSFKMKNVSKKSDDKKIHVEREVEEEKKTEPGKLTPFLHIVFPILRKFTKLLRKIKINVLYLHIIYGGADDPASAALRYGKSAATVGVFEPMIQSFFASVKKEDLYFDVDFTEVETKLTCKIGFTLRIGQLLLFLIQILFTLLPVLLQYNKNNVHTKKQRIQTVKEVNK